MYLIWCPMQGYLMHIYDVPRLMLEGGVFLSEAILCNTAQPCRSLPAYWFQPLAGHSTCRRCPSSGMPENMTAGCGPCERLFWQSQATRIG